MDDYDIDDDAEYRNMMCMSKDALAQQLLACQARVRTLTTLLDIATERLNQYEGGSE